MIKSTANGLSVEVIDLIQRRITFIYIYIYIYIYVYIYMYIYIYINYIKDKTIK